MALWKDLDVMEKVLEEDVIDKADIFQYLTPEASDILDPIHKEIEQEIPINGTNNIGTQRMHVALDTTGGDEIVVLEHTTGSVTGETFSHDVTLRGTTVIPLVTQAQNQY